MASLLPAGKLQFWGTAGPLNGGKVYLFDSGTAIPRASWKDEDKTDPNQHPIILDQYGMCTIFGEGSYTMEVRDAGNNLIYTQNDVTDFVTAAQNAVNALVATVVQPYVDEAAEHANRAEAAMLSVETLRDSLESLGADVYVELLADRTNGFSFDFTHPDGKSKECTVKDTTTPANNYNGPVAGILTSNAWVTPRLCKQSDGTYKYQPHNDILQANALDTTWARVGVGAPVGGQAGSHGTNSAWLITSSAATAYLTQDLAVLAGWWRTKGVKVRLNGGTSPRCYLEVHDGATVRRAFFNLTTGAFETVDAALTAAVSSTDEDGTALTNDFRYISVNAKWAAATSKMRLGLCDADNNVACTVGRTMVAEEAQAHRGVKRLPYMATTAAAVRDTPYDYTPGYRAVRQSQANTFHGRYADDMTNAAWVAVNITPLQNATGPHGEPCSSITATAAGGTIMQAIVSAGNVHNGHALIRRKTGSGTLEMTMDAGATWTDISALIGSIGGEWKPVWLNSAVPNPTLGFRVGTNGDAFEVCCANESSTVHMPAPAPSTGLDYATSVDTVDIQNTKFPLNATNNTLYTDVYIHPSSFGLSVGNVFQSGFFGAGSIKNTTEVSQISLTEYRLEHGWHDGVSAFDDNYGDCGSGRLQIQQRSKANDDAFCYNGKMSWWNSQRNALVFTSVKITAGQDWWLRRMCCVPEAISDDNDSLRKFKLREDDANVDTKVMATGFIYRAGVTIANSDLARIPAMARMYARGDDCEFVTFFGAKHDPGYNTEHPQRIYSVKWRYNRVTKALLQVTSPVLVVDVPDWAINKGGVQGSTCITIEEGPYKGRTLLVYIQQDSVSGTSADDHRNLYRKLSDDKCESWGAGVKILDKDTFLTPAVNGFVATGENSTIFQIKRGTHKGRVVLSLNVNNQNHRAMWCDDFKEGGDGSGLNWSYTSTANAVDDQSGGFGTLTEPAIAMYPNDQSYVMYLRNSGGGIVGYSVSTDFGATWSVAQQITGDNASHNVNMGAIQDDPDGQLGLFGRIITARSTLNGRIDHKIQQTYNVSNFDASKTYRCFSKWRFIGYCPLLKLFDDDWEYAIQPETQPGVLSNVDTSHQLCVFRLPPF